MNRLISVIVPAYNIEKYIGRCIESICRQTHKALEIIVINDGSTDATGEIIEKYAQLDSRIVSVYKENGGVSLARLEGIKRATGEYIGFVDGDDEIEPNMYERLLNNAQEHGAQISHCGFQMHFTDGRIHYFHNTGVIMKQDRITALRELLSGAMIEPGLCNKLFHKTLLQTLFSDKSIDTSIKINEDLLMNFCLFSAAETTVFDDWCPYHYIVRNGSASRAKLNENKIYDPIKVKRIIMSLAEYELQEDAKCAYINTCINTYNLLLFSGTEYRSDMRIVRDMLKKEKDLFETLGTKRWLMAWLITWVPFLYAPIYRIYSKCFQEKIYT